MTTEVNPTLGKAENLFKDLVWDSLVEAGIAALFSAAPWLNFWLIRGAVKFILKKFADAVFEAARLTLDLSVISFLNTKHKTEYDAAATRLKIIAHSYGVDSPQFMEEKKRAKEALARFVAYNR